MCTLVVAFYPKSRYPLVIAANRDEDPARPSEDWAVRTYSDTPDVFCPLDVRKGTWIGVNRVGIFCAVTNWDIGTEKLHGMQSRGEIVLNTLKCKNLSEIMYYWQTIDPKKNKPFNIIAGNKELIFNLSCNNLSCDIIDLPAGLHISTGWGLNQRIAREVYIRDKLKGLFEFNTPVAPLRLRKVMSMHNAGIGSEHSICVHDYKHRWETRSSALIVRENGWNVSWVNDAPCRSDEKYNHKLVEIY